MLTIKFCSPRYFGIYMYEGNAVRVYYFQLKITTDATSTRELYSCSFLRGKDESIWLYPFTFIVDLKLHLLLLWTFSYDTFILDIELHLHLMWTSSYTYPYCGTSVTFTFIVDLKLHLLLLWTFSYIYI